jgi:hypothetical protein
MTSEYGVKAINKAGESMPSNTIGSEGYEKDFSRAKKDSLFFIWPQKSLAIEVNKMVGILCHPYLCFP